MDQIDTLQWANVIVGLFILVLAVAATCFEFKYCPGANLSRRRHVFLALALGCVAAVSAGSAAYAAIDLADRYPDVAAWARHGQFVLRGAASVFLLYYLTTAFQSRHDARC